MAFKYDPNKIPTSKVKKGYSPSKGAKKIKDEYEKKVLSGKTGINSSGLIEVGKNVPEKMGNISAYLKKGGKDPVGWALQGKKEGSREYDNSLKALEGLNIINTNGYTSPANSGARAKQRAVLEEAKKEQTKRDKASNWQYAGDFARGVGQSLAEVGTGVQDLVGIDTTEQRRGIDEYYKTKKSNLAKGAGELAGTIATIAVPGGAAGKALTSIPKVSNYLNTGRKAFAAGAALDTGISSGVAALKAKKGNKLNAAKTDAIYGIATMGLGKVISKVAKKGGKLDKLGQFLSEPISINKSNISAIKKEISSAPITPAEKISAIKEFDKAVKKVETTKQQLLLEGPKSTKKQLVKPELKNYLPKKKLGLPGPKATAKVNDVIYVGPGKPELKDYLSKEQLGLPGSKATINKTKDISEKSINTRSNNKNILRTNILRKRKANINHKGIYKNNILIGKGGYISDSYIVVKDKDFSNIITKGLKSENKGLRSNDDFGDKIKTILNSGPDDGYKNWDTIANGKYGRNGYIDVVSIDGFYFDKDKINLLHSRFPDGKIATKNNILFIKDGKEVKGAIMGMRDNDYNLEDIKTLNESKKIQNKEKEDAIKLYNKDLKAYEYKQKKDLQSYRKNKKAKQIAQDKEIKNNIKALDKYKKIQEKEKEAAIKLYNKDFKAYEKEKAKDLNQSNVKVVDKASNVLYKQASKKGIKPDKLKTIAHGMFGDKVLKEDGKISLSNLNSGEKIQLLNKVNGDEFKADKELLSKEKDLSRLGGIERKLGVPPGVLENNPIILNKYHELRAADDIAAKKTVEDEQYIYNITQGISSKDLKKVLVYAYGKQKALGNDIGGDLLKRIGYTGPHIKELPEHLQPVYNGIRKFLDNKLKQLTDIGAIKGGYEDYFPIFQRLNHNQGGDVVENLSDTIIPENIKASITKMRKGEGEGELEPSLTNALIRYANQANQTIYLKPEVKKIRQWMEGTNLYKTHKIASSYLENLLNFTVKGVPLIKSKTIQTVLDISDNVKAAAMFFKPLTALMTLESTASGTAHAPEYIHKGIQSLFKGPKYSEDGLKIIDGDASSLSREYWKRERDPSMHENVDLSTVFRKLGESIYDANGHLVLTKETYHTLNGMVKDMGYNIIKVLDAISYKITFNANYYKALKKGKSAKEAADYADDIAIKTHSSSDKVSRPAVQRTELGKAGTAFLTPVMVSILEKMKMGGRVITGGQEGRGRALATLAAVSALTEGVNQLFVNQLQASYPSFNLSDIAVAGYDLAKGDMEGFDKRMSNIEQSLPGIGNLIYGLRLGLEEHSQPLTIAKMLLDNLQKDSSRQLFLGQRMAIKDITKGVDSIFDIMTDGEKYSTSQKTSAILKLISLLSPITALPARTADSYSITPNKGTDELLVDNVDPTKSQASTLRYKDNTGLIGAGAKTVLGLSSYSNTNAVHNQEMNDKAFIRKTNEIVAKKEDNTKIYNHWIDNGKPIQAINPIQKEFPGAADMMIKRLIHERLGTTVADTILSHESSLEKVKEGVIAINHLNQLKNSNASDDEILRAYNGYLARGLFEEKNMNALKALFNNQSNSN